MHAEQIAQVAHAANQAYRQITGEPSGPDWNFLEESKKESVVHGVEFVLKDPSVGAEEVHNEWVRYMVANGWRYGSRENAKTREHPNLRSWESLLPEQKMKDKLFVAIVRSLQIVY